MQLCVSGLTALRLLRIIRGRGTDLSAFPRCGIVAPDPAPVGRWTLQRVKGSRLAELDPGWKSVGLNVAVPSAPARIQSKWSNNVVYKGSLPDDAFLDLGDGLFCACPELLFIELSRVMPRSIHSMLGYELCGTFSRDADDPRMGEVRLGIAPATSVERIRSFMDRCDGAIGLGRARCTIDTVADNAWSAMEAMLGCVCSLSIVDFGYSLGPIEMNRREELPGPVAELGEHTSRVPDIMFAGTPVGINYDGGDHLDFSGVEQAFEKDRGDMEALREAEQKLRAKVRDDQWRDWELVACGDLVMPLHKEDIVGEGALDRAMLLVARAIERFSDRDVSLCRQVLEHQKLVKERQKLIWSLYPWKSAGGYARELVRAERNAFAHAREETAIVPVW